MFGNRYSKTLTVILIIVIVIILGLLIYFGISAFQRNGREQASAEAFEQFQNQFTQNTVTNTTDVPANNIDTNIDLNSLYGDTTTGGSGGTGVTYMGYDVIGTIEIPATDVKYPIIPEYQASLNSLNVGIVMLYPSNIGLNEVGNTVLAGHNYKDGTFFSNNKRLEKGDKIYITDTSGEKVEYVITKKYETDTGDSTYMNRDTNGKREISLTTCTDDTRGRLIIWAEEVE